jgi:enoyl-CoA hydratase/carnithine racemase
VVPSEEALRIGLVDAVFPAESVYEEAVEAARRYARGPTQALRAAKLAITWGGRTDLRTGLVIEREAFVDLFATKDRSEGMAAFVDKREARFEGR